MQSNKRNDNLKHYLKELKTLLPLNGKLEKKFISELEFAMMEYVTENPDVTLEQLHAKFGSPSDMAISYFESIDTKRLISRIIIAKWIRIGVIVLVLLGVIFFMYRSILVYQAYLEVLDQKVVETQTIIIEE